MTDQSTATRTITDEDAGEPLASHEPDPTLDPVPTPDPAATRDRDASPEPESDDRALSTEDIARSPGESTSATTGATLQSASTTASDGRDEQLFDDATADRLQARWQALQVEFVDEPRGTAEKADALVAEVMKQLAETFARERRDLEAAWSGGREASTEDLRQAIRRYRSFFNRLLSI